MEKKAIPLTIPTVIAENAIARSIMQIDSIAVLPMNGAMRTEKPSNNMNSKIRMKRNCIRFNVFQSPSSFSSILASSLVELDGICH